MKKIKYGNKKYQTENRQLDNLKEGDQICEAVLDTFSDDYLSYITHLVKNTKTPNKNVVRKQKQQSSSEEKQEKIIKQSFRQPQVLTHMKNQSKIRTHSVTNMSNKQWPSAEKTLKHKNRAVSKKDDSHKFITNINEYLIHLEQDKSSKSDYGSKKSSVQKALNRLDREKRRMQSESDQDLEVHKILKQNMKLKRIVKAYEQKIQQLQDEISGHFIHCKNRDKNYKSKINDLLKALTQSVSKINSQKNQIASMKHLLKSFGQKARQFENENSFQ